jgi:hypothetical protein
MAVLPGAVYLIHKKLTTYGAQPWKKDAQKKKPE